MRGPSPLGAGRFFQVVAFMLFTPFFFRFAQQDIKLFYKFRETRGNGLSGMLMSSCNYSKVVCINREPSFSVSLALAFAALKSLIHIILKYRRARRGRICEEGFGGTPGP